MLVTFLSIPVWAGPNPLLGTCPILLGTRDTGSCLLASISTSSFAGAPGVGKGWRGSAGRANLEPHARALGASTLLFGPGQLLPASLSSAPGMKERGDVLEHWLRLLHREWWLGSSALGSRSLPGASWRCCKSLPRGTDRENPP